MKTKAPTGFLIRAFLLLFGLALPDISSSQSDRLAAGSDTETRDQLSFGAYGAMNYYAFDWQTDSSKRNAIDHEFFVAEMKYQWTDKIRLNTEIEFEHGGTGTSLEFDRFEEFGEFEFEISKGGEVIVEEMNLEFDVLKNARLQIGRLEVPFGASFERSDPVDYSTATYSEMEAQILPRNWTENGILFSMESGIRKQLHFYAGIVNGLDGSAFNSANWIKRGNQKRFELISAESFAFVGRVDYTPIEQLQMGISLYGGNTTGNRPKPDLQVDTPLGIGDFHFQYKPRWATFTGMFFYGALGNSETLTNANRNLSNNLNVKRTPVAAAALGAFGEIDVPVIQHETAVDDQDNFATLTLFGRADYYDTMFRTQGEVFNNPRWERMTFTFGGVWKILEDVQIKTQYAIRTVGAPAPSSINGGTQENTFVLGFAFEI